MPKTTSTIHQGNALDILRTLPAESIQTCVTSPPYYGLRDYGTAQWSGGSKGCDHINTKGLQGRTGQRAGRTHTQNDIYMSICGKCGARRDDSQLGLEGTPGEYIEKMVAVFSEVYRVLKKDGSLWLNLGDSYYSTAAGTLSAPLKQKGIFERVSDARANASSSMRPAIPEGFKPKDLMGMPWRVAFALQESGWYLRQDIIWHKPNPMPESVKDRCTKAHEYIFLLSKSEKYYFDQNAILEPCSPNTHARISQDVANQIGSDRDHAGAKSNVDRIPVTSKKTLEGDSTLGVKNNSSFARGTAGPVLERNKRSVWTVTTQPVKDAHFATYPEKLIEPCILAGSREGDMVLDPFSGSGTTGRVALAFKRSYTGIELNPDYIKISDRRTSNVPVALF